MKTRGKSGEHPAVQELHEQIKTFREAIPAMREVRQEAEAMLEETRSERPPTLPGIDPENVPSEILVDWIVAMFEAIGNRYK